MQEEIYFYKVSLLLIMLIINSIFNKNIVYGGKEND